MWTLNYILAQTLHFWKSAVSFITPEVKLEIFTDASLLGWGATCLGREAKGRWSSTENSFHINHLEVLAAILGLQSFAKEKKNYHILFRIDNTTAISYIY